MPITFNDVIKATEAFTTLHYANPTLPPISEWKRWDFVGTRPYTELPVCYAVINIDKSGQEVINYIGVSTNEEGLGARIKDYHHLVAEADATRVFEPNDPKTKAIYFLGFDKSVKYIAKALEAYLIMHLNPVENK